MHIAFACLEPILRSDRGPGTNLRAATSSYRPFMTTKASASPSSRKSVLFVCLGNICRSPAAEAVFKAETDRRGLSDNFAVESCGTGGGYERWLEDGWGYHEGDSPDARMREAGKRRGLKVVGQSRILRRQDFDDFRWIIGMDRSNLDTIAAAKKFWGVQEYCGDVKLLSEFSVKPTFKGRAVPDPYYGGERGFDHVLDLLEDCCIGLMDHILERID